MIPSSLRGIVANEGEAWVKQRRFGLRTLRDLGFGRRTIENIINEEIDQMMTKIAGDCERDSFLVASIFNIPLINVLWQLVAGHRFDEADPEGRNVIDNIVKIFKNYISLSTYPLSLTKLFRGTFFEENLNIVRNQRGYIQGKKDIK